MVDVPVAEVDRASLRSLVVGDLLAILALVAIGEIRHHFQPWQFPRRYLLVALPFLAGWLLAAVAVGAYSRRARTSAAWSAALALAGWLAGAAAGMALRDTAALPGNAHPVFYLVMAGFGGAFLLSWRLSRLLVAPALARRLL